LLYRLISYGSTWGQFHQRFTCNFYKRRSQKCKNSSQVISLSFILKIIVISVVVFLALEVFLDVFKLWVSMCTFSNSHGGGGRVEITNENGCGKPYISFLLFLTETWRWTFVEMKSNILNWWMDWKNLKFFFNKMRNQMNYITLIEFRSISKKLLLKR